MGLGKAAVQDRGGQGIRLLFQPQAALSRCASVQGLGCGARRRNRLRLWELHGPMPPSAGDHAVSEEVSSYWVNFAKTGDPKGGARPHGLAFTATSAQVMNLNDSSRAISVPNLEK